MPIEAVPDAAAHLAPGLEVSCPKSENPAACCGGVLP